MSLVSPLLALIYWARSRGVHLRVQVVFPNPSLLRTAGFRTFLVSRGLLRRCQLAAKAGPGDSFVGLLSSGTLGRPIGRNRGVTPSSVAPECLGDSKSRAGTRVIINFIASCVELSESSHSRTRRAFGRMLK